VSNIFKIFFRKGSSFSIKIRYGPGKFRVIFSELHGYLLTNQSVARGAFFMISAGGVAFLPGMNIETMGLERGTPMPKVWRRFGSGLKKKGKYRLFCCISPENSLLL